jgi:hypothetical protein
MKLFDKEELKEVAKNLGIRTDEKMEHSVLLRKIKEGNNRLISDIVTFNGNGSRQKNEVDIINTSTISYGNFKGQYKYLFSEIARSIQNIDDYLVLCPLYQKRDNLSRRWEYKFDYQLAVTGKAKLTEPDGKGRFESMSRELAEELNLHIDIIPVSPIPDFPKFKFGWGVIQRETIKPDNDDFDFKSTEEDFNRRVMAVVLENKNAINIYHKNNHFYCETDIVGIYRKPLRDVLNELRV